MVKLRHLQAKIFSRACHCGKGVTIIELLIVVIIIALAAAIVVPRMGSAGSMQVRAAADMIAADLEYAKSMAISRQSNYTVIFNTSTDSYQIRDASGVINHPVKVGSQFIVNLPADSRLGQVDITNVSFSDSQVKFDRLGSPDNGGTIIIEDSSGSASATITVQAVTGYISVSY